MRRQTQWLLVLFALWIVLPLVLSAQPGPTPDPGQTTPAAWYTSVAGVVAATVFVVSLLKRALANVPVANAVPTWCYAVLVAGSLTYLANAVWGTMPGELWQLLTQAVQNAATASGIYEWVAQSPTTTLRASAVAAGVKGIT